MTDPSRGVSPAFDPYQYPPKLAEWLVHGTLSSPAAEALLSLICEKAAREQGRDEAWAAWLHGLLRHLTHEHAARLSVRRDLAEHAVRRTVQAMLHEPSRRILAEAHNANQDHAYVLDEAEVQIAAADVVRWNLARRTRRG